ncbi:MAG: amidophosphoribosyltransferase [Saprospiraceae bacterium]
MSDQIKHECGIAFIRLLKPLEFYVEKYGTPFYGLNKMHLLMQKQRNRGQDGAGVATIKLDTKPGTRYISRKRSNNPQSIKDVFEGIFSHFQDVPPEQLKDAAYLKENFPYIGELLLGHLRYGTHGENTIESVHPFLRQNNWMNRNLVLAGNFNLTNVDEMFDELVQLGQYPKEKSDTVTVMEKIGHFLDDEVQRLHTWFKPDGHTNIELNGLIANNLDIQRLLKRASKRFDGGFAIVGMIGHGDAFVMRDANGIRPAFFYKDDEVVVVASERPAIQTAFNVNVTKVKELTPGHVLIVKKNGKVTEVPYTEQKEKTSCSFERIYFSRGTDRDIYIERKMLGSQLAKPILESVKYDFDNTVFSFVPNTAEFAFYGLMQGLNKELNQKKSDLIIKLGKNSTVDKITKILNQELRIEKVAVKEEKQRTFIAADETRGEMVSHVYDVSYGIVHNEQDTIVLLDDSIVRGTTLRDSIIKITARLKPKKIIIVSSAPQIRYPDCYGIDMSRLGDFVAFRAMIELLKESGKEDLLNEVYENCKKQLKLPAEQMSNQVKVLYDQFSYEEISNRVAKIVTPKNIVPEVEVIFQTLEGLRIAIPNHTGDWYFSGNYPTAGGNRVVNKAFINYMEGNNQRAYS